MKVPFLDLSRQHERIAKELNQAISRVLHSSSFILGREVRAFEDEFAEYLGLDYCVTCGNGTDALEMALQVLDLNEQDEVIVPGFGWPSALIAGEKTGCKVVLADVEKESGNISLSEVEQLITSRTKVVVCIHLFGNPCEVKGLKALCDQHDVHLIEDCSQAHGAMVNGKKVGGYGTLGTYSFYPTKNLGSLGDGGAIVTRDKKIADRLRSLRDYGRVEGSFVTPGGRNSRLDEIQGAVLRTKLSFLDQWNCERKEIVARYGKSEFVNSLLMKSGGVQYKLPLKVNNPENLTRNLNTHSVGTELQSQLARNDTPGLTNAQSLSNRIVNLPFFIGITDKEIDFCCERIEEFYSIHDKK